jgi:Rad3-related DNA helicase
MGIFRGKISEGLDFKDDIGRTVVCIGVPYPKLTDPKVILKKIYLDNCSSLGVARLKGDEWYL